MSLESLLIYFPIFVLALCLHEYAHAWTAVRLGDPTPRWQGRLTLNPKVHLSLVGTILFALSGIGWANPVHVNPRNLNNPKSDMLKIALAGPLANLAQAVIFAILYHLLVPHLPITRPGLIVYNVLIAGIHLNAMLFVFNLIPVPPLDGSKILARFAPARWSHGLFILEQYGVLILLLLMVFLNLGRTINILAQGIMRMLGV